MSVPASSRRSSMIHVDVGLGRARRARAKGGPCATTALCSGPMGPRHKAGDDDVKLGTWESGHAGGLRFGQSRRSPSQVRPRKAETPPVVLAAIEGLRPGDAADAAAERAGRDAGWR